MIMIMIFTFLALSAATAYGENLMKPHDDFRPSPGASTPPLRCIIAAAATPLAQERAFNRKQKPKKEKRYETDFLPQRQSASLLA